MLSDSPPVYQLAAAVAIGILAGASVTVTALQLYKSRPSKKRLRRHSAIISANLSSRLEDLANEVAKHNQELRSQRKLLRRLAEGDTGSEPGADISRRNNYVEHERFPSVGSISDIEEDELFLSPHHSLDSLNDPDIRGRNGPLIMPPARPRTPTAISCQLSMADSLLASEKWSEALVILDSMVTEDPSDFEAWWRKSKAEFYQSELAKQSGDSDLQKSLLYKSVESGEAGQRYAPQSPDVIKWLAISVGSTNDFESVYRQPATGLRFYQLCMLGIDLSPDDASFRHMIARFYHTISRLSWVELRAADAMAGESYPRATIQDALAEFKLADELLPHWPENMLEYSRALMDAGNYKLAKDYLERVVLLSGDGFDDKAAKKSALQLLRNPHFHY